MENEIVHIKLTGAGQGLSACGKRGVKGYHLAYDGRTPEQVGVNCPECLEVYHSLDEEMGDGNTK